MPPPREMVETADVVRTSSSSSASSSSSSSASLTSCDSEDEDNPYVARPLPSWLLQDLAAVSTDPAAGHARGHAESGAHATEGGGAHRRAGETADDLTDTSNRSSHGEVSIEIASLGDDATDTSLLSLRSAASLEDFSETNSDASDAPAGGDGVSAETLREAAIRDMNQMRWSAMRQQVSTARARSSAHSLSLTHSLSCAPSDPPAWNAGACGIQPGIRAPPTGQGERGGAASEISATQRAGRPRQNPHRPRPLPPRGRV